VRTLSVDPCEGLADSLAGSSGERVFEPWLELCKLSIIAPRNLDVIQPMPW
jgi:hypothetical protein